MKFNNKAIIVTGLGFGDEGKGSTTLALARKNSAKLVVRFNGGGQAGHTITNETKRHVFNQFGCGTFDGIPTLYSHFCLFDPVSFLYEFTQLQNLGIQLNKYSFYLDTFCKIVTPYHVLYNQLQELERQTTVFGSHGSCGKGIGVTVERDIKFPQQTIRALDLQPNLIDVLKQKIQFHRQLTLDYANSLKNTLTYPQLILIINQLESQQEFDDFIWICGDLKNKLTFCSSSALLERQFLYGHNVVFEGAQGILLDEKHGFHPHTTWSNCTTENARTLISKTNCEVEIESWGCMRAYSTRHGNGPFPTYCSLMNYEDKTNFINPWQGNFRQGLIDLFLLEYAIRKSGGIDYISLSNIDQIEDYFSLSITNFIDNHFDQYTQEGDQIKDYYIDQFHKSSSFSKLYKNIQPTFAIYPTSSLPSFLSEKLGVPVKLIANGPDISNRTFI